ncbi:MULTISPECIES: hypothetical protein [Acinetobacter]|uniref:hypothetical protein n=1 Tax=Acinetobacter TaxID=469 RepID=UPI0009463762|nr:hypothetical protein [Acinetobacter radioresistens]MCK4081587.1 hypothetical protein [Acinetobacter radioresistens]MCU4499912.1 hypothetical protein [Acinetobacter radioresistens]RJL73361.1 hypothetical protein D5055_04270 [Acinetobacter radioresistens]
MAKNWLIRTNQSITFLPMIIVIFIGLIGYEWLRAELVGSWALFIALLLLGRFLNLVQAVILSVLIFLLFFIYLLFDIQDTNFDTSTKILQLFILPIAPLFLSIYYEIMSTNQETDNLLDAYRKNLTYSILPIGSYQYNHLQFQRMLSLNMIQNYAEIRVDITNHELLRDMLQVDEFKAVQQKIFDVLETQRTLPHFYFTDTRLSIIRIIIITDGDFSKVKELAEQLRVLDLLKMQITINTHTVEESSSEVLQ